jgi:hypothetical protein
MPHPNIEDVSSFSRSSVYLRLLFQNELLARATGLLAQTPGHGTFLITALHNFTGREPDGRCKSSTGGVPNFVEITGYWFHQRLALYENGNDPNTCTYKFWRHPLGPLLDIAVLPVQGAQAASALDASFLHPTRHGAFVRLSVSQLCFVVGYPEGLFLRQSPNSVLPIWKTGHIASEPSVYVDDVPKLLIDVATCEGMSGSPVYVSEEDCNRLVGIYTGRTSQVSELGFVFAPEVILKIIETGPISGRLEYPIIQ